MNKLLCVIFFLMFVLVDVKSQWIEKSKYKEMPTDMKIDALHQKNDSIFILFQFKNNSFMIREFNISSGREITKLDFNPNFKINFTASTINDSLLIILSNPAVSNEVTILIYNYLNRSIKDSINFIFNIGNIQSKYELMRKGNLIYDDLTEYIYFSLSNYYHESYGNSWITVNDGCWGYFRIINHNIIDSSVYEQSFSLMKKHGNQIYLFEPINDKFSIYDISTKNLIKINYPDFDFYELISSYHYSPLIFDSFGINQGKIYYTKDAKSILNLNEKTLQFDSTVHFERIVQSLMIDENSDVGIFSDSANKLVFVNLNSMKYIDSILFDDVKRIYNYFYFDKGRKLFINCLNKSNQNYDSTIKKSYVVIDLNNILGFDADFNISDTLVYVNQPVTFSKKIPDKQSEYTWSFGDGMISENKSPVYKYSNPGYYDVTLSIRQNNQTKIEKKEKIIRVINENIPDFTSDKNEGIPPLEVHFTNLSQGDTDTLWWDFGDGNYSIEPNPIHTYKDKGLYNVKLTTKDIISKRTNIKYFYINTNSVETEEIKPEFVVELPNGCYSWEENLVSQPLRGFEFTPGTDYIFFLYECGSYSEAEYVVKEKLEQQTIIDNKYIQSIVLSSRTNNSPTRKPIINKIFSNNFYPDSGNYWGYIYNQRILPIVEFYYIYPNLRISNDIYLGSSFVSSEYVIQSNYMYPVDSNKSYFEIYRKVDTVLFDDREGIDYQTISYKKLDGNISNFESISDNEFLAVKSFVNKNQYQINTIIIDNLGTVTKEVSNQSNYNSIFINNFKKLSDDLFVASGLVGNNADSGNGYLASFNSQGKLIKEIMLNNKTKYLFKVLPLSKNEFIVMNITSEKNHGFYLFNSNLEPLKDYRIKDTTFKLFDMYITSDNKIKLLGNLNKKSYLDGTYMNLTSQETDEQNVLIEISNNIPVSIDEDFMNLDSKKREGLIISPNPSTDFLTINLNPSEGLKPSEGYVLEVYNLLGLKIITEPIHPMTSSHRMNLEKLPAGVYFVKIGDRVEKFIKM